MIEIRITNKTNEIQNLDIIGFDRTDFLDNLDVKVYFQDGCVGRKIDLSVLNFYLRSDTFKIERITVYTSGMFSGEYFLHGEKTVRGNTWEELLRFEDFFDLRRYLYSKIDIPKRIFFSIYSYFKLFKIQEFHSLTIIFHTEKSDVLQEKLDFIYQNKYENENIILTT